MENKKIIIIIPLLILLTGCTKENFIEDSEKNREIYIDKETCVEYFNNYTYYGNYVLTPKYKADGSLYVNEECLKNKGE